MLTSCYVESPITLEKHFIEVDYNAQEIILNADEEILKEDCLHESGVGCSTIYLYE